MFRAGAAIRTSCLVGALKIFGRRTQWQSGTTTPSCLAGRPVHRVGFGAMQLPGPGVFGPPADRPNALGILRRAVDSGVDHIDTAQFYGPDVANELIHEALPPLPRKSRARLESRRRAQRGRQLARGADPGQRCGAGVEANLKSLELDQVPVVNLRRHPETAVPFDEQIDAMKGLCDEGLIGAVGLSNVTLDQYLAARSTTEDYRLRAERLQP